MSEIARNNLQALQANPYPGRGIIVGLDETGERLVQVYWIMGRSPNSRNRIFVADGGAVRTEAADPAKVADPSLIIYNALAELTGVYIATNGDQTDTIVQAILAGGDARVALATRCYEPDAPNYTPRISALCSLRYGRPVVEMSILKRSAWGAGCDRQFFVYESFDAGLGRCLTTYAGDGDPLPSFEGEPKLMPLTGDIDGVLNSVWTALNEENRISLAVKFIHLKTGDSTVRIVNKYEKV